jgi:hypothetical protein
MPDQDRLISLILEHWSRYHPKMVERLRRNDLLETALDETAENFSCLLYELVSVKKMEYHQAWELAIRETLQPEESSSTT